MSAIANPELDRLLQRFDRSHENLIPVLQEVQNQLGFLPPEAIEQAAEHLNLSIHDVFSVASFYSQFRFQKPGRHCLKVCEGTACHVRGSDNLLDSLSRRLGIEPGQTTADGEFNLERVMCLGSCALAPAVVKDDTVYGRMTQNKVDHLLNEDAHESAATPGTGAARLESIHSH
jgi:NADH:ubiquinone oxidoreductase subunit E